jgi:hypothetical protein
LRRGQQSLPPGCREGERRSGRHRRDHGEAWHSLKRPVGSDGPFSKHAELPANLGSGGRSAKPARKPVREKPKKALSKSVDKAAEKKAALAYERQQKRRDDLQEKEEATRQKERERGGINLRISEGTAPSIIRAIKRVWVRLGMYATHKTPV